MHDKGMYSHNIMVKEQVIFLVSFVRIQFCDCMIAEENMVDQNQCTWYKFLGNNSFSKKMYVRIVFQNSYKLNKLKGL